MSIIGCDIAGISLIFAYFAYFIALVPFVLSRYFAVVHSIKLKFKDAMKGLIIAYMMLAISLITPTVFGGHYSMGSGKTYCFPPWFRKDPLSLIPIIVCISLFIICTLIMFGAYYWYYRYLT
jgi:hypothetical protein